MPSPTLTTFPQPGEYADYYAKYVAKAPKGDDVIDVLQRQLQQVMQTLQQMPDAQAGVLHPPYTWSIRQVVGHLIDSERIFAYRALRIARGDATPLPGFDENHYAKTGKFDDLSIHELAEEFEVVRKATIQLFRHMPADAWPRQGQANGNAISVRALAWILVGHVQHHIDIVRQRLGA